MSYLYSKLPETGVSPHIGTGGALILLEHLLKHGESAAPRSWTSA